ncbi:MAG: hypothetical protein NT169_07365 [Chloroflexi bacterium]|nr:hypothetical protein [Chloroflexota bacterium]
MAHRTTIFELLGGVGMLGGDLFAILSLTGSILLLLITLLSRRTGRRSMRAPEQIAMWSFGGLLFGIVCVGSIIVAGMPVTRIGFLFGLSLPITITLLLLSAALLAVRTYLRRRP